MGVKKNGFAEKINFAEVMASGFTKNLAELSRRGVDEVFIERLRTLKSSAEDINNDQEALKAQLKTKTVELDRTMADLGSVLKEGKAIVKLQMDQSKWREFGIEDKR